MIVNENENIDFKQKNYIFNSFPDNLNNLD